MADKFTKTGEYFMTYDQNLQEQVISFKHKASDSTFDDGMTLEEKLGGLNTIMIMPLTEEPETVPDNTILFLYE